MNVFQKASLLLDVIVLARLTISFYVHKYVCHRKIKNPRNIRFPIRFPENGHLNKRVD